MTSAHITMRQVDERPNRIDCSAEPLCAALASGLGGRTNAVFHGQYTLDIDPQGEPTMPDPTIDYDGKPPYRVPTLDEVRATPWNGHNVVTTFAGAGGSSTGYRMAGYRILYAVEFIPAAGDSYAANKAPYTVLDRRDVRQVTAAEILAATGLRRGQLDLFDGSPPCEPFSSAGKRDKKWNKVNKYSEKEQRSDDLFFEYARLLEGLQPKAFVAENVAGLVRGRAVGYFKQIHKALQDCGYTIEARLLDAQWLGVPQTRSRLIFVGLRNDLAKGGRRPLFPTPLPYRYSVRDALPHIFEPNGPYDETIVGNEEFEPTFGPPDVPSPTVMAGGSRTSGEVRRSRVVSPRAGTGFTERDNDPDKPHPTILANGKDGGSMPLVETEGPRLTHDVDHGVMASQGPMEDRPAPTIVARRQQSDELLLDGAPTAGEGGAPLPARYTRQTGGANQATDPNRDRSNEPAPAITGDGRSSTHHQVETKVTHDPARSGSNRTSQGDVTDRPSPTLLAAGGQKAGEIMIEHHTSGQFTQGGDVTDEPAPSIKSRPADLSVSDRRLVAGSFENFHDKQDVTDAPSPALLTGQPNHYLVENDGTDAVRRNDNGIERRKLTIPELKALSSFPPDYVLTGSYSQQWERCGDCVPPLMMLAVATSVRTMLDALPKARRQGVDTLKKKDAK